VAPPGEARSDLEIWLDYARRMGFSDRSGRPLPRWDDAEGAFEAWRECSRGRPCDYSGLTWDLLRGSGGIQWPCTDEAPGGTERLYGDGVFPTSDDYAETYGHDLLTGGTVTPEQHRALRLDGRARLRAAPYVPGPELPSEDYPFSLNTGRTVHHFHTRTKTRRTPQLQKAAPDAWAEMAAQDAREHGLADGDQVEVASARGRVEVTLRVSDVRPGTVFLPFHFGDADSDGRPRAANELTLGAWDPVSKQPVFKTGAVRVTKVGG
jgi:predicted molibdopterin-dependent oxidoreductase YjgC